MTEKPRTKELIVRLRGIAVHNQLQAEKHPFDFRKYRAEATIIGQAAEALAYYLSMERVCEQFTEDVNDVTEKHRENNESHRQRNVVQRTPVPSLQAGEDEPADGPSGG